jgi:hypothetical protein
MISALNILNVSFRPRKLAIALKLNEGTVSKRRSLKPSLQENEVREEEMEKCRREGGGDGGEKK